MNVGLEAIVKNTHATSLSTAISLKQRQRFEKASQLQTVVFNCLLITSPLWSIIERLGPAALRVFGGRRR